MTNYTVEGNTYKAKRVLNDAGFKWDAENKEWVGNQEAKDELERITKASYSRANQKAISDIRIMTRMF